MNYLKIGQRNALRNRKRSFLTAFIIGIGIASVVLADGLMVGMQKNLVKTATSGLLGQGQISHENFPVEYDASLVIEDPAHLELLLKNAAKKRFLSWSKRIMTQAMLASPEQSRNIVLMGLNRSEELKTTSFIDYLYKGSFLEKSNTIVLGEKLRHELNVEIGDKVVITSAHPTTGELVQDVLRVEGTLKFSSKELDGRYAFVRLSKAQSLLGLEGKYHQVVLNLGSIDESGNNDLELWKELSFGTNLAQGWRKISPGLTTLERMTNMSTLIISIILMILVSLGIINTLFMSLFERVFEFGVIRALGTKSHQIFQLVLAESVWLGIFGLVIGLFLIGTFGSYLTIVGIDYGGIEFNQVTFREPIKIILNWYHVIAFPFIGWLFSVAVAIYPAFYATRMTLARAIRKTL